MKKVEVKAEAQVGGGGRKKGGTAAGTKAFRRSCSVLPPLTSNPLRSYFTVNRTLRFFCQQSGLCSRHKGRSFP